MYAKGIFLTSLAIFISGCASNKPFDAEQIAVINQHQIVVQSLPDDYEEKLPIYSGGERATSEAIGVALGLLTGSWSIQSDGTTPRTRFPKNTSLNQAIKIGERKAMAEVVESLEPTKIINDRLATYFPRVQEANEDAMTITIEPVAWHLFYDKVFEEEQRYFLEYASDITLELPAKKLRRTFVCDKQSSRPLPRSEWFANDALRIRSFVESLTSTCTDLVLSELHINNANPINSNENLTENSDQTETETK